MPTPLFAEEEKKRLRLGIVKVEAAQGKALSEFWNVMREALRNPKSEKDVDRFDARITGMLVNREEREIFEALEREMKAQRGGKAGAKGAGLEIGRAEADAFFAYASAGKTEERISAMLELRRDVEKGGEAIRVLEARAENATAQEFAKIAELAGRKEVGKEELEAILGKGRNPELLEAVHSILQKQEAASLAARNALGLERNDYERIFGIAARNEALAMLALYRRILGDARFSRARESAMRGELAGVFAELRKLGLAAQYVLLALLAPSLMRNGMWSKGVLGILAKALSAVRDAALKSGKDPEAAQAGYLLKAEKFVSIFGDYRGMGLSLFSASFVAALK